jgi:DNA-binding CsgD family transcriptional regulator
MQVEESCSLEDQEKFALAYLDRKFGVNQYNAVLISDKGLSGTRGYEKENMRKQDFRPGLTIVTELAERKLIQSLVINDIARLARDLMVFLELTTYYLRPNGVTLITVLNRQESKEGGRDFLSEIDALHSAEHSRNLSIRVKQAAESRREAGLPATGCYGYGWKPDGKAFSRKVKRIGNERAGIAPVEDQLKHVRMMYDWVAAGRSYYWIQQQLIKLGISSPSGKVEWPLVSIINTLNNPLHCGHFIRNGTLEKAAHFEHRILELEEYLTFRENRNRDIKARSGFRRSPESLLGAIAQCALCGRLMQTISPQKGHPNHYCQGIQHGVRDHGGFSILRETLEETVVEHLKALVQNPKILSTAKERLHEILDQAEIDAERQIAELREDLARLAIEKEDWVNRLRNQVVSQEQYDLITERWVIDQSNREEQLAQVLDRAALRDKRERHLKLALNMIREFKIWDAMDIHQKRNLMRCLIEELFLEPINGVVRVHLKLVFQEAVTFEVRLRTSPRRRPVTGLAALTATELTSAYYWQQGNNMRKVSDLRDALSLSTLRVHKRRLIELTGASDFEQALQIVTPVIEKRRKELLIDKPHSAHQSGVTKNERKLLRFLAQGMTNPQIAEAQGKSLSTIANQRARLYERLRVTNALDALRKARKLGVITGSKAYHVPTRKQMEVLRVLNTGKSQPAVAKTLKISLAAVKERLKGLYRKYQVPGQNEMLDLSRQKGWLEEPND